MAEESNSSVWTKEVIMKYVDEKIALVVGQAKERDDFTKELLTEKINANKELANLAMANAKEAVTKAENTANLKFEIANNVKEDMGKRIDELKTYVDKQVGSSIGKQEIKQTASDWKSWLIFAVIIIGFIIDIFIGK